jgi:hypothetical protein
MKILFSQKNFMRYIMLFFFCLVLNATADGDKTQVTQVEQQTKGDQSSNINQGKGNVKITYEGLSEDIKMLLSKELNNNHKLINKLLNNLYEKDVAIKDYKVKMNQWIERYKELEQRVEQIEGQNKLVTQVKAKLNDGNLEGAESMIAQNVSSQSFQYAIIVESKETSQPISNAGVTIQVKKQALMVRYTDANGFVRVEIDINQANESGKLKVNADGYEIYEIDIDLVPNSLPQKVLLNPIEVDPISFKKKIDLALLLDIPTLRM